MLACFKMRRSLSNTQHWTARRTKQGCELRSFVERVGGTNARNYRSSGGPKMWLALARILGKSYMGQ